MEQTIRLFGRNTQGVDSAIKSAASNLWNIVYRITEVSHQRHQLSNLDNRLLNDIGIDRAQALKEANRPLWDV